MPKVLLLLLQYPPRHWQQLQRRHLQDPVTALPKAVTGLLLGVLSPVLDINLFYEEVIGEGEAWRQVRPLQASVGGVSVVSPPPRLHHPPYSSGPPWLGSLQPLSWVSSQCCPAGHWAAAGAAMGSWAAAASTPSEGPAMGVEGNGGTGTGGEGRWGG